MDLHFSGLPIEHFQDLFDLSNDELVARGMRRYVVDSKPGFPCRITLEDAEPGEEVILLSYAHQPAEQSPYRSEGPIFVRQSARESYQNHGAIPSVLPARQLSLRGYDKNDLIIEAEVIDGKNVQVELEKIFANNDVVYVHIHNAKRGCFSCRVDRAENRIASNVK